MFYWLIMQKTNTSKIDSNGLESSVNHHKTELDHLLGLFLLILDGS